MNDAIAIMMLFVLPIDVFEEYKYLIAKLLHIPLDNRIGNFIEFYTRAIAIITMTILM